MHNALQLKSSGKNLKHLTHGKLRNHRLLWAWTSAGSWGETGQPSSGGKNSKSSAHHKITACPAGDKRPMPLTATKLNRRSHSATWQGLHHTSHRSRATHPTLTISSSPSPFLRVPHLHQGWVFILCLVTCLFLSLKTVLWDLFKQHNFLFSPTTL